MGAVLQIRKDVGNPVLLGLSPCRGGCKLERGSRDRTEIVRNSRYLDSYPC